ncbi:acyl carrier protein [Actinomadura sp. 9N215]|uniref:acyl carrier protein n=1 Tax=Actinomadura sp. 9N215 TaxID=3375150 RepID=UPI0037926DD1
MNDVATVVRDFILGRMRRPGLREGLDADGSLIDEQVLDSLGVLEVASFLERRFLIEVDPAELVADNFETLNKIAGFVARKLANQAEAQTQ